MVAERSGQKVAMKKVEDACAATAIKAMFAATRGIFRRATPVSWIDSAMSLPGEAAFGGARLFEMTSLAMEEVSAAAPLTRRVYRRDQNSFNDVE
jgi:hypothetical protein